MSRKSIAALVVASAVASALGGVTLERLVIKHPTTQSANHLGLSSNLNDIELPPPFPSSTKYDSRDIYLLKGEPRHFMIEKGGDKSYLFGFEYRRLNSEGNLELYLNGQPFLLKINQSCELGIFNPTYQGITITPQEFLTVDGDEKGELRIRIVGLKLPIIYPG